MKVRVRLFAVARQLAGSEAIELDAPDRVTVGELRRLIAETVPDLESILPHVLFAVDAEYATAKTVIRPGAEVACIPPVSGG